MSRFAPDFFVFSVAACSARGGLDFDIFEAEFKRAMIPNAGKTMLLADTSKFMKTGLIQVCDWTDVDVFISDSPPDPALQLPESTINIFAGNEPEAICLKEGLPGDAAQQPNRS